MRARDSHAVSVLAHWEGFYVVQSVSTTLPSSLFRAAAHNKRHGGRGRDDDRAEGLSRLAGRRSHDACASTRLRRIPPVLVRYRSRTAVVVSAAPVGSARRPGPAAA